MAQADAMNENFGSHKATIHQNLHIMVLKLISLFRTNLWSQHFWDEPTD